MSDTPEFDPPKRRELPDRLGDLPDPGRRRFTQVAGTSLLTGPMLAMPNLGLSQGYDDSENANSRNVIERIVLNNPAFGRILLTGILVILASGLMYYVNVSQGAIQNDEDRIGTGSLFGGLTRPTIAERLEQAVAIGNAHIIGTILVLIVATAALTNPAALPFLLGHRDLSWDVPRLSRISGIQGLPPLAQLQALAVVGTLFLVSQSLLMALVSPVGRS
ncbi:hypothetical protein HKCCE3408_18930 [Rhodobacterales bacterium HKCCE3408]|nr:hypothetical protein [Rhodobacterales bacterium HKCCE3408]